MNFLEGIRFWLADGKKEEISSDDWLNFVNRQYDPEMVRALVEYGHKY